MTWLAGIAKAIGSALGWLVDRPSRLAAAVLAAALLYHSIWIDPRLRDERDDANRKAQNLTISLFEERQQHRQTKLNYRAAQVDAARAEEARIVKVAAQQKEITDEVAEDFRRRLADARARAGELREQRFAGTAADGATGSEPVPPAGHAAGRTNEASGEDRLPDADRLIATEQALQLDALISWVERQAAILRQAQDGRE